jgi:hypothetical protein
MVVEQRRSPWMDSTESPMNPCSVETIPEPIELADGSKRLMLSCYQLKSDGSSVGRMSSILCQFQILVV